jgi:signal transduction histidine kinase
MVAPVMDGVPILLVDDEPRNLDALEAILADPGYTLVRAEDADRALRVLLEHDVAAIILDIQMPRVNGIELAHIIKGTKRFRQIPIVFLTAHLVDDQDILTGYGAGAVDYLTKPFKPEILRHKVAVFAELFRKSRALSELNEQLEERVRARTSELERSEAALRAAGRQKDEFLAVLAHELRNPLAPLRTGVDLLMQVLGPQTPVVGKTLGAMSRQIDHIVRLIDDLLDVSRISRGVLELKKQRSDLGTICQSALETLRPFLDQKKLVVEVTVSRPVHGVVDPTRIAQIVGNLLHNASKYTPAGGVVSVEITREGQNAVIRVKDNGVGIPPDQLPLIFEMFTRIERKSKAATSGVGIGLALARRLAQMHGGDLSAASEGEGMGSTFTLTLPAPDVEPQATATEPTATAAATGTAAPAERSHAPRAGADALDILVIEDNDDAADTLAAWLEELGHRVLVARTGPTGLDLVLAHKPDVVLCDVGLPEMDGVEVCQRVRQMAREFRPYMVALTGWGMEEDRRRTAEAGFDHHLVKPVALDALSELLKNVVAKSSRPLPS